MPQETEAVVSAILAVLLTALIIAVIVLVVAALISILTERDLTGGGKLLWVLGVLYIPILGSVAWFVVGRKGYLNQFLGITRSGRHAAPTHPATHAAPGTPTAAAGQQAPTAPEDHRSDRPDQTQQPEQQPGQRPAPYGASAPQPRQSSGQQTEDSGLGHA